MNEYAKISVITTKQKLLSKVIWQNRIDVSPGIDLQQSQDWESCPGLEPLEKK